MSNNMSSENKEDNTFISVNSKDESKTISFYHINIDNAYDRDNYDKINMKDRLQNIVKKNKK